MITTVESCATIATKTFGEATHPITPREAVSWISSRAHTRRRTEVQLTAPGSLCEAIDVDTMSRIDPSQPRALTLTEELEKLEQSITLTLQEIDHNFSRAHRIVTSSILPVVEQYANHSKEVWEGSKFWKQFFESSANVSLSGYEEQSSHYDALDNDTSEATATEDSHTTTHTTLETSESYETPTAQHISTDSIQDLDLSNMTISPSKSSTPRPVKRRDRDEPHFADDPSPYDALRQEVNATAIDNTQYTQHTQAPSTPGAGSQLRDLEVVTPNSSPFLPPNPTLPLTRPSTTRKKTDPLLHRVLDKNYRVQATPLASPRKYTGRNQHTLTGTPSTSRRRQVEENDNISSSSPAMPAPDLNPEIFSSPERKQRRPIPGVSVLTPARFNPSSRQPTNNTKTLDAWDSDEEDDSGVLFDQSPPKTMQFHVPLPQSKLMQTPAKEASKRIVQDIMSNAGLDYGEEELDFSELDGMDGAGEQTSPSVVRAGRGVEDDTF
jgi:DASH complex subunit ASK1